MAESSNPRLIAAQTIVKVVEQQGSLARLLPPALAHLEPRDRALAMELCYGVLRWLPRIQCIAGQLLRKPMRPRDRDIEALVWLGLYQLLETRVPAHAAVAETVAVAGKLNKKWAKAVINGVLRNFQRRQEELIETLSQRPQYRWSHPDWLLKQLQQAWPDDWQRVAVANNGRPPMTLRVNRQHMSRLAYQQLLQEQGIETVCTAISADGLTLSQATDVTALPGFAEGWVSVQDEGAQLAAQWLQLAPGQRVLDACCAPGGKTGHILEIEPALEELLAVDLEPRRLQRVEENMQRLGGAAKLLAADVGDLDSWWDGQPFDRILLDVPCSATGVIRRHPDIKSLRRATDISSLADVQQRLLAAVWTALAPGGMLLYGTCSILPQENESLLQQWIKREDVAVESLPDVGLAQAVGRQLLPLDGGHDGFYYACLRKTG